MATINEHPLVEGRFERDGKKEPQPPISLARGSFSPWATGGQQGTSGGSKWSYRESWGRDWREKEPPGRWAVPEVVPRNRDAGAMCQAAGRQERLPHFGCPGGGMLGHIGALWDIGSGAGDRKTASQTTQFIQNYEKMLDDGCFGSF